MPAPPLESDPATVSTMGGECDEAEREVWSAMADVCTCDDVATADATRHERCEGNLALEVVNKESERENPRRPKDRMDGRRTIDGRLHGRRGDAVTKVGLCEVASRTLNPGTIGEGEPEQRSFTSLWADWVYGRRWKASRTMRQHARPCELQSFQAVACYSHVHIEHPRRENECIV